METRTVPRIERQSFFKSELPTLQLTKQNLSFNSTQYLDIECSPLHQV